MHEQRQVGRSQHRASYLLERGVWRATCQQCGYQVADGVRRQAAAQFRLHIQAHRGDPADAIDLRDQAAGPPRAFTVPSSRTAPVDTRLRQTEAR